MPIMLEATGGFEPPNRGFADPRLRPLGYVASKGRGAEEETRTPTAYSATAPSTLRVYQFHHLGVMVRLPTKSCQRANYS